VVLDSGALIAFERGDERIRALLRRAGQLGVRIVIPAGVLAQVWRDSARQVVLGSLLRASMTAIDSLDRVMAEAAGVLCGRRQTADVIDASVVLTARREHAVVVTSDVDDLRHLDPGIELHSI
jgi:predicted nucleic acid-binding protein